DAPVRQGRTNASVVVPPLYGQDVKIDGPPTVARTYHFDGVFGPKATQENVYDKIVNPILNEVMQGYNCTIFAYGQTGTGKTYTMEGDLEQQPGVSASNGAAIGIGTPQLSRIPTPASSSSTASPPPSSSLPPNVGNDLLSSTRMSSQAGIIPRTLSNMFYALEKNSSEYYVRVSYLELYNEELRDLLAGVDITDTKSGPRFNYEIPTGHLKVYESGTDKGVVIQGLEERIVSNARDAIALMQAGAMRRKVAATKCNDSSSRSHAIFTITVFVRERAVTVDGEDIVKLGKLNLVDLAGSENIGRSGAQGMRAQEAGNINKSLLVLGRVINALVERNSYVPYRDSKLTYILKDSLGGRTRTCMIATMSTAPDNIEETIKTLQYASQAKGIRNRPVANKKVSKSEIVHDMQLQIEQLRKDLDAARDGTGFFITRDTYEELTKDARASKEIVDEWKQRVALWEEEMMRMNQRCAELSKDKDTLEHNLEATQGSLGIANQEIDTLRVDLRHRGVLVKAHAMHEERLDGAARLMRRSLEAATADVHGLHGKVARMAEREQLNLAAIGNISRLVAAESAKTMEAMVRYGDRAKQQTVQLLGTLSDQVGQKFESAVSTRMAQHAEALKQELESLVSRASADSAKTRDIAQQSVSAVDALLAKFDQSVQSMLVSTCAAASSELVQALSEVAIQQQQAVKESVSQINATLASSVSEAVETIGKSNTQLRAVVEWMACEMQGQEAKNCEHVRLMQAQLEGAAAQSRAMDEQLLGAVTRLVEERRQQESAAFGQMTQAVGGHASEQSAHRSEVAQRMAQVDASANSSSETLVSALQGAQARAAEQLHKTQAAADASAGAISQAAQAHSTQMSHAVDAFSRGPVGEMQSCARTTVSQTASHIAELLGQSAQALGAHAQSTVAHSVETQATTDWALQRWRESRQQLDELAQTQAQERAAFTEELGAS
ncbi:Kinesin- motor protein, partial [Coemansia sp. RSA 2559]